MPFHYLFTDSQPHAGSFMLLAQNEALKDAEYLLVVFRVDSRAVVADRERVCVTPFDTTDLDHRRRLIAVLDRVGDQIFEDLPDAYRIAHERRQIRRDA
jgi:hypothetical protein